MPLTLDQWRRLEAPRLVRECAELWGLRIGEAYPHSYVSVVHAVTRGGGEAVLKVAFPHREAEGEAEALRAWGGEGAVRLLAHDPGRGALLLERCRPGTPLSAAPGDELDVLAGLLPRLWVAPPASVRTLAEEAAWWIETLPTLWRRAGRPVERSLLDEGVATLRALGPSQDEVVLLHQDLHAGNVVRAEREPWLVIDPKPLVGERAFSLAPVVRSAADPGVCLQRLCDALGLDRERARGWALGQALAWSFDGRRVIERNVAAARALRAS